MRPRSLGCARLPLCLLLLSLGCHSDSKSAGDAASQRDAATGMDASSDDAGEHAITHDIAELKLTEKADSWEGTLPVDHDDVTFVSEIDVDAERVRAWIQGPSARVEIELSSMTEGQVTINGTSLDGYGALSARERAALDELDDDAFITALGMIPLEIGCRLGSGQPADPRLAALLLPLQLLLKYSDQPPSVSALEARASCRYFVSESAPALTNHDALRLSNDEPFPAVYGFQLLDEAGAATGSCPSCKTPLRPCGALCPHACGADCDEDACELEECAGQGGVVMRFTCGSHQGCVEHDDCYDRCNTRHGCDANVANFVCHRNCDLQCINDYGLAGPVTWSLLLSGVVANQVIAVGSVLYPCGLWATGRGPFTSEVVASYVRSGGPQDDPSTCEPLCGDGVCDEGESPETCAIDCRDSDGALSEAGVAEDAGVPATLRRGGGWGDPHLYTYDGLHYDFQLVGEFVLVELDERPLLQVRTRPYGASRSVAVIAAVSADVNGDLVEMHARQGAVLVLLNGEPSSPTELPGGGEVTASGITWPDGSKLDVSNHGSYLNIVHRPRTSGSLRGLLGNSNGDPADDLSVRDGTPLPVQLDDADLRRLADAWRVDMGASLFTYEAGTDSSTFTDLEFPAERARAGALPPAVYASARATCSAAGITDDVVLEACILDVGITGESAVAEGLGGIPSARLGTPSIYSFAVAPSSLSESHVSSTALNADATPDGAFTVRVRGPLSGLVLMTVNESGTAAGGQQWDTTLGTLPAGASAFTNTDSTWLLGAQEHGALINQPSDGKLPLLDSSVHELVVYAQDTGYFRAGQFFKLVALGPDGSFFVGPLLAY